MNHRMAMLVMIVLLAGCRSGASTVPPPGTGGYQQPNQYYQQPSATPTFTAPTYGAPAGAAAPTPGFSANNPSFAPRPNVSLASNANDGLAWKSVTTQPVVGRGATPPGTINPRTTLTTIRGTGNPVGGTNGGLRDMSDLPMVSVAGAPVPFPPVTAPPSTSPLRSMAPPATAPIATPMFSTPAPYTPTASGTGRYSADPWRGR